MENLKSLGSVEGFDPKKHIGVWADIDDTNMVNLLGAIKGIEDDGFHMINRALVLDIPKTKINTNWQEENKELLDKIQEGVAMVRQKGHVRAFPCKVGSEGNPSIALFFSVKQGGETDNVLMLQMTYCYKGLIKPKTWGEKREMPVFQSIGSKGILTVPLLQEVI